MITFYWVLEYKVDELVWILLLLLSVVFNWQVYFYATFRITEEMLE
jgi:hypothetical protein